MVLDENAITCGCGNGCVKNVESNNHQRAKICKCRGRRISMPAKELPDKMEKDWNLGEIIGTDHPDFKDLIFALPVSILCAVRQIHSREY